MSQFVVMKPLTEDDYRGVIARQTDKVVNARLFDEDGRNIGKIRVQLSPRYKKYLFNETVIPSEGARSTVVRTQGIISTDLEKAISALPKSKFGAKPILLSLDFLPGSTEIVVSAKVDTPEAVAQKAEIIMKRSIALTFPRIDIQGKIPQQRLSVSAHELGHALVAARLGLRIDQVVVVPTTPGAGGYVKFKGDSMGASEMMAKVYATLASRAMERIIFSKDPKSDSSVLEITAGPSQDIKQATYGLFNMIYELGFDPNGGTIDRNFTMGGKYADYASIPPELAEKLGKILRAMENQVLDDLLESHTKEWYVEKTIGLARQGAMSEQEFYALIGYEHPGENIETYGRTYNIREMFQRVIRAKPAALKKAQGQRRGLQNETVEETVERYLSVFAGILQTNLHPEKSRSSVMGCHKLFQ
ncbi:MAG: hypothetical protein JNM39_14150 [Bdellovibrionaceae bacterium]|nr:hypothetical protein [Pseudobdellovibrionaceae bacterium]